MAVSAADRLAISELIALHRHIMDSGELDRLEDLFSPEVTYDLGDLGLGTLQGIEAISNAAVAMGGWEVSGTCPVRPGEYGHRLRQAGGCRAARAGT